MRRETKARRSPTKTHPYKHADTSMRKHTPPHICAHIHLTTHRHTQKQAHAPPSCVISLIPGMLGRSAQAAATAARTPLRPSAHLAGTFLRSTNHSARNTVAFTRPITSTYMHKGARRNGHNRLCHMHANIGGQTHINVTETGWEPEWTQEPHTPKTGPPKLQGECARNPHQLRRLAWQAQQLQREGEKGGGEGGEEGSGRLT